MSTVINDYMPMIWNDLMAEYHNEIGVAGLMGNLYAESGCTPYACQPTRPYNVCQIYINNVNNHAISEYDFVHYGCSAGGGVADTQLGFGLAQWTYYSRKQGLYTYMFANGSSIADLENQIEYVIVEINANSALKNAIMNATNIDTITDYILANYENPKDQSTAVKKKRRGYATDIYDTYHGTTPVEPAHPQPPSPVSPVPVDPNSAKGQNNRTDKMPLWMMLKGRFC